MRLSALALGVLLLGAAPIVAIADEIEDAFQRLKTAQTTTDVQAIKKAAVELHGLVCKELATPEPAAGAEKELWANHMDYAKSLRDSAEYALYATAIQQQPPALIDLISTLEQANPKSKYLDDAYGVYLVDQTKAIGAAKTHAIAEKALVNFPENEDLLLYLLNAASAGKQSDRALSLANRLVNVMTHHPKPQTVSAGDWERKKEYALMQGYYTAGIISSEKGQYLNADKNLRAALPLVKEHDQMLAATLFHLGVSNYQLGKMTMAKAKVNDAARFSEQCAAIDSPFADQARHNALVMKKEAATMR
jgi:hypothetical protein